MRYLQVAVVQGERQSTPERCLEHYLLLFRQGNSGRWEHSLVVLPENWLGGLVLPWQDYLIALKRLAELLPPTAVLAGGAQYVWGLPEVESSRVIARGAFVAGGEGRLLASCDKFFPSRAVGERHFLSPGWRNETVEWNGWRWGAVICVDLFYPELVRSLALGGCLLVVNPVNVPVERSDLWLALARTRAAENTIFVVVANNTGTVYPDGRQVKGGSLVVAPDGTVMAKAGSDAAILTLELDSFLLEERRRRWPYLRDIAERLPPPLVNS